MSDSGQTIPLQNRVAPDGSFVAVTARGTVMGNRGGRLHNPEAKCLHPTRRWASRQWICCALQFKHRHRTVMGHSYSELFFLDDVTAFAAGHRPCYECRRADFRAFAAAWQQAQRMTAPPRAGAMDLVLHDERLEGRRQRVHKMIWGEVPDGAIVRWGDMIIAKKSGRALAWSFDGYGAISTPLPSTLVDCLTPPSTLAVLASGYRPLWHPTAD